MSNLILKWGTLRGWRFEKRDKKAMKLLKEYRAMCQKDTPRQKEIICELIDLCSEDIYLNWDSKIVSKEEAKKYIMEYRR